MNIIKRMSQIEIPIGKLLVFAIVNTVLYLTLGMTEGSAGSDNSIYLIAGIFNFIVFLDFVGYMKERERAKYE